MENYLITEEDLLEKQHITIMDVINHYYNSNDFIWMMKCLSEKHGCGCEHVGITFWDDLDDYDRSFYEREFTGVELHYLSDEEKFSLEEFYFYIEMGAKKFMENLTEEEEKNYVNELLLKIKSFFKL